MSSSSAPQPTYTIAPGAPGYDPKADPNNEYSYTPALAYGLAFVVIFSLSTFVHLGQTWFSRRWWLLTLVAGGLGETLGWVGRLWGHFNPDAYAPDMVQIVCLIICPAFFSAAVYAILGWIITELDPSISLLRPGLYWKIFIACDVVSLLIQSGGGGIAASANDNLSLSKMGSNIMLSGIVFQFIATVVFAVFFAHFLFVANKRDLRPAKAVRWLVWGNVFATAMILVRGAYRIVELAEGWNGYLLEHEQFFLFDAIPMVLLMVALNITHPCWTLRLSAPWAKQIDDGSASKHSSGLHLTRTESV